MNNPLFRKVLLTITFTLCLVFFLLRIEHVADYIGFFIRTLHPFLIGCFAAFLINIPMRWIEKLLFLHVPCEARIYRFKRPIGLLLTLSIVTIAIVSILKLIVPAVSETVANIISSIPDALNSLNSWLLSLGFDTSKVEELIETNFPTLEDISLQRIAALAADYINQFLSTTTDLVSLAISGFMEFIIAFFFSLYLLFSKETLSRQFKKLLYAFLPENFCDRLIIISQLSVETFCDFFSGQFTEACILGFMFFITMTLMHMPYAVLVSVLIAVTAIIPVFGAFVGCAIGALLILIVDPMQALVFLITFQVLQQLEDNLIYPHVVGNRVGLPSIWVLVAVTVGGGLMGILGMLLFIPAFSVIYKLLREHTMLRLTARQISDDKWIVPFNSQPLRIHRIIAASQSRLRKFLLSVRQHLHSLRHSG